MPNKNTFKIKPIQELIQRYIYPGEVIVDPFANDSKIATITNDIDEQYDTNYHLDALDFLKKFKDNCIDIVLYDPPYSSRQVSECYKKINKSVNKETTQSSYWSKQKEEIARILKQDGICISCGWNSNRNRKDKRF